MEGGETYTEFIPILLTPIMIKKVSISSGDDKKENFHVSIMALMAVLQFDPRYEII